MFNCWVLGLKNERASKLVKEFIIMIGGDSLILGFSFMKLIAIINVKLALSGNLNLFIINFN